MAVYRITIQFKHTTDASLAQNVIHMEDPAGTLTPAAIGGIIENTWWGGSTNSALRLMTANAVSLDFIWIQRVDTTPPGGVLPYSPVKTAGTKVSNVWHEVVGFIFRLFDGGAGPSHRGRVYHFGTANTDSLRTGPSSGNVAQFNTLHDTWMAAFGPTGNSGLKWVLWHRNQVGNARWTQITDIRLSDKMGIQRRRNPGIGL